MLFTYARLIESMFIGSFDAVLSGVVLVGFRHHQGIGIFHFILRDNVILIGCQWLSILEPVEKKRYLLGYPNFYAAIWLKNNLHKIQVKRG